MCGHDSPGSEQGLVVGSCGHSNEPSGTANTKLLTYMEIILIISLYNRMLHFLNVSTIHNKLNTTTLLLYFTEHMLEKKILC
jgi:hypothetical protein